MDNPSIFLTITPVPFLSVIVWILLISIAMYFARKPFHRSMGTLGKIIRNALKLASVSVKHAENRLQMRNREVLISAGLEMAERKVEREFDRIAVAVQRDLEGYPHLQRKLNEELHKMEEDYEKCAAIPQALPDWVKVIDAIAHIKPSGDRMVVNMLEEIHNTLNEQHKAAVEQHRRDVSARHSILNRMVPIWRRLHQTLDGVGGTIANLGQRSKKIDQYMDTYESIRRQDDAAYRQLSSSSLTQFFISGLVLAVAVVGAVINFHLVKLPMSEMVGGTHYIGRFLVSDVAGMFIVCLEIVVGVFLMDSLRITRLFSIIGSMEDNKRRLILWILLAMLTILAGVESSLAYMRDSMVANKEALIQSLSGREVTSSIITTIGQMIMGFILPFILTFVAIPFESFVASARTLLGVVGAIALRVLAFLLRLIGFLGYYACRLIVNLYDLIVFPGIWLEDLVSKKIGQSNSASPEKRDEQQEQKISA